ncbi:MAG TPA: serine O-acetyltransferase [Chthonomonadaceae bacterium]|nr:serine O-acetyltransferase [Chthonomonadaceae bacterium]
MFNTLREDLRRKAEWYDLPPTRRALLRMCFGEGSTAQILYRAMRFCQTHHLKPLALLLYRYNATVSHMVIGRGADIGPGLVIVHSIGIVINTHVRAGRNLVIQHGVTIGAEKDQSPVLGDNVFIGAGAKVLGAIRIGSDVKIGANAVVTKDLPDGATAVGIPARVIKIYGKRVSETGERLPESLDDKHAVVDTTADRLDPL